MKMYLEQIETLKKTNDELCNGNQSLKGELEQANLRLSQMKMPEVEDVDFERDSNQGTFMQKDTSKKQDAE